MQGSGCLPNSKKLKKRSGDIAIAPSVVLLGMVLIALPHSARSLKMDMPISDPAENPSMEARENAPSSVLSPKNSCRSSEMSGLKGEWYSVESTYLFECCSVHREFCEDVLLVVLFGD